MVSQSKKNESQSGLKIVLISTAFYKLPRKRFLARFGLQNRPHRGPPIGINSNLALGCPSNTVFRPRLDQVQTKFRPSLDQVQTKNVFFTKSSDCSNNSCFSNKYKTLKTLSISFLALKFEFYGIDLPPRRFSARRFFFDRVQTWSKLGLNLV